MTVAREDALRDLQELLQEGRQINGLYICTSTELDDATQRRLRWVGQIPDLLAKITGDGAAAAYVDAGAPDTPKPGDPIELHIEHFHNEMSQRLERLQAVRKLVEGPSGQTSTARPLQPQPVVDDAAVEEAPSGVESVELNLVDEEGTDIPSGIEVAAVPAAVEGVSAVLPASKVKPASVTPKAARPKTASTLSQTKVLLIQCSRNGTARQAINRFGNQMNLSLEIVDYNPDQPHNIIDQLYRHRDAQFAIVYWGEPSGRELPGSAHPERYVGFALGFALGRLGRGRVFILGSTTTPPLPGFTRLLVAQLDSSGGWQIQLARRMKAAGVDIDLNKLT